MNIIIYVFPRRFSPKSIPVYHCCTGHLGTLTWGKVAEYGLHHLSMNSLENAISYPYLQFTENRYDFFLKKKNFD